MATEISGVSRSGRVRKKSAKVIEMEELEKSETNGFTKINKSSIINPSLNNGNETDQIKPLKKKLKIKFNLDDGGIEEIPIENSIDNSEFEKKFKSDQTLPSLKIKLFQNSLDNYSVSPKKTAKPVEQKKHGDSLIRKPFDTDNAANLIFQQIRSGQVSTPDPRKKTKKKVSPDLYENVLFDSENSEDEEEETSLVISDSNESLAAALEHAKTVKNFSKNSFDETFDVKNSSKFKKFDFREKDKKKKTSKITAYTLFAKENRHKIQQSYPNLNFANISKRLGEVWQALPPREKMQWKRKAQKQKGFNTSSAITINSSINSINSIKTPTRFPNSFCNRTKQVENNISLSSSTDIISDELITSYLSEQCKPITTTALDVSSYLKLLGESLSSISLKLNEQNLNDSNALDLLLDSTLCALCPLLCLTNLTPETNGCTESLQKKLIENIDFLMPGI